MKTNYFLITMLLLLSMTSCSTYYRMTSRVERDGSMYREIYAQGDSAFIAGDKTHNPFLFQPNANWQLVNLDSTIKFNFWGEEEKLNVKACQKLSGVDGEYFTVDKGKEHLSAMAIPMERVKKSFRWFYTYYIYTATYKELQDKGPVPLDNYLNKEEQMIWLHGNDDAFRGMNGIEMNDKLDKLEAKFGEWYKKHSAEKGDSMGDADIEEVCGMFDKACSTKYFSDLYKTNKEMMDALCEEKINIAEVFYHAIQFELTLPGRLLTSNAKVLKDNVVIWKIDGFRLLAGDYILTAESRVINYWAFGITLFMMLFVLGIFIKLYRRRS